MQSTTKKFTLKIFNRTETRNDAAVKAEALWQEHGAMLIRSLRSYESDQHLLQDLAQNVFIAIQTSIELIEQARHPKAYLLRIAHNVATDHITRELRKPVPDDALDPEDAGQNPAQLVEAEHKQVRLMQAIRNLPLSVRQVIVLLLEGVEQSEIAEVLGISHGNVRVRINRGKQLLQEALADGDI